MSEERMEEALRALRQADWNVEPEDGAEVRALLAFRRQRRRQARQRLAISGAIAAAAAVAILAVHMQAVRAPAPEAALEAVVMPPAPPLPEPPPVQQAAMKSTEAKEVVTPFYPLMPSAPPLESGLLVRVTVRASALRTVGIPVDEDHLNDPVLADVLVGQDDLARAIRFVSYQ